MEIQFLAIDAGGSRCRALLADSRGNITGRGHCRSSANACRFGAGRSEESFRQAVREALSPAPGTKTVCCATSRCEGEEKFVSSITGGPAEMLRNSEYAAALAAAGQEYGYVCLAGTGAGCMSFCPGREPVLLDGLGPHLGDFGSGFWIGKRAIEAAARSGWDPKYRTSLARELGRHFLGLDDISLGLAFVPFLLEMPDRSVIASAAAVTARCAEEGDGVSAGILKEAGRLLCETLRCLAVNIAPWSGPLPVVCAGSVINSPIVKRAFEEEFARALPGYRIARNLGPQIMGHLLLGAKETLGAAGYASFASNLTKQKEMFS
ncbi:MAG: hypothetical protein ILO36_04055 [Abditibacteriota bacterium]|nr:hypothetical protein [Abditibacteriota bacterium]